MYYATHLKIPVNVLVTYTFKINFQGYFRIWGHAVSQLVEALRYKLEGHEFDSRWCHWNFSLT